MRALSKLRMLQQRELRCFAAEPTRENCKDVEGKHHLLAGGFVGLDYIEVFDRSRPPTRGHLEQAEARRGWAFYCATMLAIALELAREDPAWRSLALVMSASVLPDRSPSPGVEGEVECLRLAVEGRWHHRMAEARERPDDAVVAPGLVRHREAEDQLLDFGIDRGPARVLSFLRAVELLRYKAAVPGQDRVGPDDVGDSLEGLSTELFTEHGQGLSLAVGQA